MHIIFLLLVFTAGLITDLSAMMGVTFSSQDPLERINYRDAFNLGAIHSKFSSLMIEMDCDENVFGQKRDVTQSVEMRYQAPAVKSRELPVDGDLEQHIEISILHRRNTSDFATEVLEEKKINTQTRELYEKECLKKLQSVRNRTLLEPAQEAATLLLLMGGVAGGVVAAVGPNSYGGSIGIFAIMFNSIWFMRDIVRSGYNLYHPPPHDLDELEEEYAINQCYIPKALWPIITEKFITARHNPFEHQNIVNYIKFSLGLTVYAPKPPLKLESNEDCTNTIAILLWSLTQKINNFFEAYEDFNDVTQIHILKMNMRKFVLSILNQPGETPRYLYLCGPGGVGKTHFAQMLVEWIKEKLPDSIRYESLEINSPEELEGNDKQPGVFLNILRNQCMEKRRGSIVVMDEANFLNIPAFIAPSKRVFNGKFSQLNTTYFGTGVEGKGITLNVPPILLLATNNAQIDDLALKSRFDVIDFPNPKPEALIHYAKKLISLDSLSKKIPRLLPSIQRTQALASSSPTILGIDYEQELELMIGKTHSFRDVQAAVPILLSQWYEKTIG